RLDLGGRVVRRDEHDAAADAGEGRGALDRFRTSARLDDDVGSAVREVADALVRLIVAREGAEAQVVRARDARRAVVEAEGEAAVLTRDQPGEEPERAEAEDPDPRSGTDVSEVHRMQRDRQRLDERAEPNVEREREAAQGSARRSGVLGEAAGIAAASDRSLESVSAEVLLVVQAELARAAERHRQHGGPVAFLPVGDALSDLDDRARELLAEDDAVGKRSRIGHRLDGEPTVAQDGGSHARTLSFILAAERPSTHASAAFPFV